MAGARVLGTIIDTLYTTTDKKTLTGMHQQKSSYTYESDNYESDGSTSAYGWHGGLKIFATENTSWNLEINSTTYPPEVEEDE